MSITALGYLIVRGPAEQWRRFGTGVLGAQLVEGTVAGEAAFRTDERAYRLLVQDGPPGPDAMVAIGFETADDVGLTALVERLRAHGVETTEDPALAERRQVTRLVTFTDPAGHLIEVSYGAADAGTPFTSPTGVRFVSGDLGLGHLFVNVTDPAGSADWYQRVLGFRLSDTIAFGPENGIFLHCNPRHHSIAFARIPEPPGLGHLMLEVDSLRAVGRAMDVVRNSPEPMVMAIGEHTNDLMTSFYVATPSGFLVEYGCNGRLVDDATWQVGHYETASTWGHQFEIRPGQLAGPPPGATTPVPA